MVGILGLFSIFRGKDKKAKPTEAVEQVEEKSEWQKTMNTLKEKDQRLYEFAIRLHLDPMRGISEKLKVFFRKEVDISAVSLEDVIEEAERCVQEGMYARAMNGYLCAIDLLLLRATWGLSGEVDEKARHEYEIRIASCLNRLRELEALGKRGEGDEVPWLGIIKAYSGLADRAEDVLDVAMKAYSEHLKPGEATSKV